MAFVSMRHIDLSLCVLCCLLACVLLALLQATAVQTGAHCLVTGPLAEQQVQWSAHTPALQRASAAGPCQQQQQQAAWQQAAWSSLPATLRCQALTVLSTAALQQALLLTLLLQLLHRCLSAACQPVLVGCCVGS
jgi:hypothetical protein